MSNSFLASYHEVAGSHPPTYSHQDVAHDSATPTEYQAPSHSHHDVAHDSATPTGYQAPQQRGAQFSQLVWTTRSNPTHSSQQARSGTVRILSCIHASKSE